MIYLGIGYSLLITVLVFLFACIFNRLSDQEARIEEIDERLKILKEEFDDYDCSCENMSLEDQQ